MTAAAAAAPPVMRPRWTPPLATNTFPALQDDPYRDHLLRKFGFFATVLLLFTRIGWLHEIVTALTGVNTYFLSFITLTALVGFVLTAGWPRALRFRPIRWWMAFMVWVTLGLPFSSWVGGSLETYLEMVRSPLMLMLLVAGLTTSWRECKILLGTLAIGAIANLISSVLLARRDEQGRVSMVFGTISNANDLAAYLVFLVPFLLLIVMNSRSIFVRLGALGIALFAISRILSTASRGALLALLVAMMYFIFRASTAQRVAVLVIGPLSIVLLLLTLPSVSRVRILTFSENSAKVSEEALESSRARQYLFNKSLEYSVTHPIFGVGLGQFPNYEGSNSTTFGTHGSWHATHNSYTAVSSECGLPALVFYLMATVGAFRQLSKLRPKLKPSEARQKECLNVIFAIQLSFVGYCPAVFFLNFAYFFPLPLLIALALVVTAAAENELLAPGNGMQMVVQPATRLHPVALGPQPRVRYQTLR